MGTGTLANSEPCFVGISVVAKIALGVSSIKVDDPDC